MAQTIVVKFSIRMSWPRSWNVRLIRFYIANGIDGFIMIFSWPDDDSEFTECKARLEHRKQESDAACDRFKAEQGRAEEAEKLIRELRRHLQQIEMNSVEQIRAKDEHIVALRRSHERLQVCVLQLHGRIDEADVFQEQGNQVL